MNESMNMKSATHLRTIADVECRFVAAPTTLFSIQPERLRTDAEFQIGHPACTNINHTSYASRH